MGNPPVTFYFNPKFTYSADWGRPADQMVVAVEIDEAIIKTAQALQDFGALQREARLWVPSKCYQDPLLMDSLKHRTAMVMDTLKNVPDAQVNSDLDTYLVLSLDLDSGLMMISFECKMGFGAKSKLCYFHLFRDSVEACLNKEPLADKNVMEMTGGLLINDESPEPSDLQDFDIEVVRTSVSKPRTIAVRARSHEEAEDIALDTAGNFEFSESESNYELV